MTEEFGFTARIWLLLLREGGRWSAAEIADRLKDDRTLTAQNLNMMHKAQTLSRYEPAGPKQRITFGVTSVCKVPRGIAIAEILACNRFEQGEAEAA